MTIVKEVLDAMKLLSDGIKSMETFISACRSGQQYLKSRHPDVSQHLSIMCVELKKTLLAMATASSTVTHFSFTVAGSAVDTEPRRFNDAFIAHKPIEEQLRQQINVSRGHCQTIGKHAQKMAKKAKARGLNGLFGLLGVKSKEREKQLSDTLSQIYTEDMMFHVVVDQMTVAVTATFRAVQKALGPAGSMDPANVRKAAKVLGEHAEKFSALESQGVYLANELQKVIDEMNSQS